MDNNTINGETQSNGLETLNTSPSPQVGNENITTHPESVPVINELNDSAGINNTIVIEQPPEEPEQPVQQVEQPNERIFNDMSQESELNEARTKREALKDNIIFVLILVVIELLGIIIYLNRDKIFSNLNISNQTVERGEII
jgi:hypothetical protein